ncbi:unnamed protein product [Heligmosomoides polygyrus]|uniref:Helicase C-terminal domain-containing protein n=1 Tax=Heligmosomoides polygyrus TaxID=6339 RepID=A0A183F6G5_HELPZ|nr:unnamed protein product [Heligmosomoides polygyrus]
MAFCEAKTLQVINMHMPRMVKQYIHRVGRTARAGRTGRSISLVGEDDRKLLKEIINTNPDRKLKQRLIAPEVVEAYRQRIDSLEDSIRQIDLEEKEEKELRLAELAVQKTEEKLENGTDEREGRIWFQKPKVGERERKRAERRAQRKEEEKKKQAAKTKKQQMTKKKSMRLSDIPAVQASAPSSAKKKSSMGGKKSTFTSALTAVGRKAVNKARHGPEDSVFQKARVAYRLKTKKR